MRPSTCGIPTAFIVLVGTVACSDAARAPTVPVEASHVDASPAAESEGLTTYNANTERATYRWVDARYRDGRPDALGAVGQWLRDGGAQREFLEIDLAPTEREQFAGLYEGFVGYVGPFATSQRDIGLYRVSIDGSALVVSAPEPHASVVICPDWSGEKALRVDLSTTPPTAALCDTLTELAPWGGREANQRDWGQRLLSATGTAAEWGGCSLTVGIPQDSGCEDALLEHVQPLLRCDRGILRLSSTGGMEVVPEDERVEWPSELVFPCLPNLAPVLLR